ncbi:hypothetical protein DXG03_002421 [Asterophora parasitica]|uniref:Uncharacterized protein n=1 Tax=Asterophora parasitica TaxID=117018 RepID=A0A9P7KES2_9AGAR|nr:hypothetical protein DXG03_002421 [Asterophora parasitica]
MICLVRACKSSYEWIIPLLYRSVTLWHAEQISKFYTRHNVQQKPHANFRYIEHLWVGSTPFHRGDLSYGSSCWPLTILDRIFNACSKLQSLYIIDLDQNQWHRLQDAVPAGVETLAMGPVHGPLRIHQMKHKPLIRHFTSAETYMRDAEIQDLVLSPHLQTFRQLLVPRERQDQEQGWYLDQTACVPKSSTLKEMLLVFCAAQSPQWLKQEEARLRIFTEDPRVVLSLSQYSDWKKLLFSEFLAEAEAQLGE